MVGILLAIFLAIFNFPLDLMAGPYVLWDLGGNSWFTIYATSFFGIGQALSIPLGKPLGERFGPERPFIVFLGLFIFFSLLCSLSPNYPFLLVMRVAQGFFSGPYFPWMVQLSPKCFTPKQQAYSTPILITMLVSVPILGTCFGGVVAYLLNWRWIFLLNIPFGLIAMQLIQNNYTPSSRIEKPFDWVGYIVYFYSVASLAIGAVMGQEQDWWRSIFTAICFTFVPPCFIFFLFWTYLCPHGIFNFHLFKKPSFTFAIISLATLFSTYFGSVAMLSNWLKLDQFQHNNYVPSWIALLMGIMLISGIIAPFLVTNKVKFKDIRSPLVIAIFLLGWSIFYTTVFNIQVDLERIAWTRLTIGVGLAFFLPPVFKLAFDSFPNSFNIEVATVFQVIRALFSSLGAGLYDTIWERRKAFYHTRLGEQLTVFSHQTKVFYEKTKSLYASQGQSNELLQDTLNRQSSILALNDCFYLMGWVLVFLLLLLVISIVKRSLVTCE